MKITVCIGSSCHLKGSRQVVERLQHLIAEKELEQSAELRGAFCLGKCEPGVSVTVDGKFFSVTPEDVDEFFEKEILANVQKP